MRQSVRVSGVLIAVAMLAACSGQEKALKAAIADKVTAEGNPMACATVLNEVGRFPFDYHIDGMLNHGANKTALDKLVQLGFLSSKPVKVQSIYGGLAGETVGSPDAIRYDLTASGKKYAQKNQLCLPHELAETQVEETTEERTLLVTQYFSAIKNPETEKLGTVLVSLNPEIGQFLKEDLPMKFTVKTSINEQILSVEKRS